MFSSNTNIVTSAAYGCGKPSSIRSMDHLPSRDHKGAEYKESFMFINRSSVSRGCSLAVAAFAAVALAGLATCTGTVQAGTMYGVQFLASENGTGYNGTALTASQVAGIVPQDNFNVVTSESSGGTGPAVAGGPVTLNDNSGSNTAGVTFSWTDYNNWHTQTATARNSSGSVTSRTANGPNGALFSGESSDAESGNPNGTATYTFSNLPMGTYDLIAYTINDSGPTSGGYVAALNAAVNGVSTGITYYDQNETDSVWVANQVFVRATGTSSGSYTKEANYAEFTSLGIPSSGGSITLSNTDLGTTRNDSVNALQLVAVPEPATLGLMIIGGLGLLLIGRKRMVGRNI